MSGCSAVWLARLTGGQKVGSSNLLIPTTSLSNTYSLFLVFEKPLVFELSHQEYIPKLPDVKL